MKHRLLIAASFLATFAIAASGATITTSTLNQLGPVAAGADPFFWANTSIAALATLDSSNPGTSCGANCASYSLDSLNFLIAGTQLYAVTNPSLTIVIPAAGSAVYQLGGLIDVAGYTVAAALSLALPDGTLTTASLTSPETFPLTIVDAVNSFDFYSIVGGGPSISAILAVQSGTAVSIATPSAVPEPATLLTVAPFAALLLLRRKAHSA